MLQKINEEIKNSNDSAELKQLLAAKKIIQKKATTKTYTSETPKYKNGTNGDLIITLKPGWKQ